MRINEWKNDLLTKWYLLFAKFPWTDLCLILLLIATLHFVFCIVYNIFRNLSFIFVLICYCQFLEFSLHHHNKNACFLERLPCVSVWNKSFWCNCALDYIMYIEIQYCRKLFCAELVIYNLNFVQTFVIIMPKLLL